MDAIAPPGKPNLPDLRCFAATFLERNLISGAISLMQRLGKNLGGYRGELIDLRAVLREIETSAIAHGWRVSHFHQTDDFNWLALHRPAATKSAPRIYLSTGIHGDEPAGPLAALRMLKENKWPANVNFWFCPCLNPAGFLKNARENPAGLDLNRQYRDPQAPETRAHVSWFESVPSFDLYLCLHEDWESHGFYLYEQNPKNKPSLAEPIIQAVQPVCPIDLSPNIEDRPAAGGIIRPNVIPLQRPDWPEAFYLITHKAPLGYTLEAPSDFPLATRVDALVAGTSAALEFFLKGRGETG